MSVYNEFYKACRDGDLEGAKAIAGNPNFNISTNQDYAFRTACLHGHLAVVQWLLQVKPDIDISVSNDAAFRFACSKGHLSVAQWLLSVKPDINISENSEEVFRHACNKGHLDIARWLQTLRPYLYEVTDDGRCRVLTLTEQQEAKRRYNRTNESNLEAVLNKGLKGIAVTDITRYTSEFLNVKGGKMKRKRTKGKRTKGKRTKGKRTKGKKTQRKRRRSKRSKK